VTAHRLNTPAGLQFFLHVGLHKTGSTTLQRNVFPHMDGLLYLGRGAPIDLSSRIALARTASVLYSDESILGRLVDVYATPRKHRASWAQMQIEALARIKLMFPECRLVVGLRNPLGWSRSVYSHYVRYGGSLQPSRFLSRSRHGEGLMAVDDFLLRQRLEFIGEHFDRPVFFFLEELEADPQGLVSVFEGALSCESKGRAQISRENRSRPTQAREWCRALNTLPFYGGVDHPDRRSYVSRLIRRLGIAPHRLSRRLAWLPSPGGRNESELAIFESVFDDEDVVADWRFAQRHVAELRRRLGTVE